MKIIKNYKNDETLRNSLSKLTNKIFGFDFEKLYENGYWPEQFNVYSITESNEVVSNVCFHKYEIEKNNQTYSAMQIGTVSTYDEHRNKGYSRLLMEEVLKDNDDIDVIYLFANESVLDFYPKFGFTPVNHILYKHENINDFEVLNDTSTKLSVLENISIIDKCIKTRIKNSKDMYIYGDDYIKMFYMLYVFSDNIYYHEKEDAIIICSKNDKTLFVHDIYVKSKKDIKDLISRHLDDIESIIYGFEVDLDNIVSIEKDDSGLFVRSNNTMFLKEWQYPITSET